MKTWEDAIRPGSCDDVIAERDRAAEERAAQIELVKEELARTKWQRPVRILQPPAEWPAERLKQLRLDLGCTQVEFALLIPVATNNYGQWERGFVRPNRDYCRRLNELEQQLQERTVAA